MDYRYTDREGETLGAVVCPQGDTGFLYVQTGPNGVAIPLDGIDEYVMAMRELAAAARRRWPRTMTGLPPKDGRE